MLPARDGERALAVPQRLDALHLLGGQSEDPGEVCEQFVLVLDEVGNQIDPDVGALEQRFQGGARDVGGAEISPREHQRWMALYAEDTLSA